MLRACRRPTRPDLRSPAAPTIPMRPVPWYSPCSWPNRNLCWTSLFAKKTTSAEAPPKRREHHRMLLSDAARVDFLNPTHGRGPSAPCQDALRCPRRADVACCCSLNSLILSPRPKPEATRETPTYDLQLTTRHSPGSRPPPFSSRARVSPQLSPSSLCRWAEAASPSPRT